MLLVLALLQAQAPSPTLANTPPPAHDAVRYEIGLSLSDSSRTIRGVTGTSWRLKSGAPLRLELDSALRVTRVTVNGRRTRWHREGDLILIPHGGAAGDTLHSTVTYQGVPRDGLIIHDSLGVRTFFADNWPNRAHRWFPSQDHPSDKAEVSFLVDVPAGYSVIANGVRSRVDTLPTGRTRWSYALNTPIPVYTMVVGVARFARTPLGRAACDVRCVDLSVWTYPADSAWAVGGPFRRAGEIVAYFSRLVGPFPYPDLAHVESSTIFGGMENSTAIFYDENAYRRRALRESTVAHETAHQWFGDAVTERSWDHLWLSEGFATYLAALWTEHLGGDSALQATMRRAAAGIFRSPATDRPVVDTAANLMSLLNTNNYNKGSWILHSLRGIVGDSAFFRGLRQYYRTYRDSTALSPDFERTMETASGEDLGWYFRQALHQPGYPRLQVVWRPVDGAVELEIRQIQKPAWGTYRLPGLELLLGDQLVRLDVDSSVTRARFPGFASAPDSVVVDPNSWWLLQASVEHRP